MTKTVLQISYFKESWFLFLPICWILQFHLCIPAEEKTVLAVVEEVAAWHLLLLLPQILPAKWCLTCWRQRCWRVLQPQPKEEEDICMLFTRISGNQLTTIDLSQVCATLSLLSSCSSHQTLKPGSSSLSRRPTLSSVLNTAGTSGLSGTFGICLTSKNSGSGTCLAITTSGFFSVVLCAFLNR